jgi:2-polyprenyl-3-methyl-5-hydroxy-6-metoxy-1,4-benzoquinol methylase
VGSAYDFPETADIETSSDDYALRFSGEIGSWFLKVQEKATLQMLAPYKAARVLDVGGGHGQLTDALIQNGYRVTVLGSSDVCKEQIRKFIDGNRCTFKVGNILDLPAPDQAFDVVISYRLLPHVNQWKRFLHELTRVARKVVLVDYPAVRSINCIAPQLFQFKKRLEGNTRPFSAFRESELLEVFESLGFARADRYAEFFLPMVLHRVLKLPALSSAMERIFRLLGATDCFGSPVVLKVARKTV